MQVRPFIGRDRELSELLGAVRAASHGRGSLWFVSGEPGIGKSRLVEELAARAARNDAMVVWGRCWEAGGAPAYWPWIQVLRALLRDETSESLRAALGHRTRYLAQLLPELMPRLGELKEPPPLDAERERFELLDAIGLSLCSRLRPDGLLVILEDLHAADASTLSVFEAVGPQLKNSHVCLVGTCREADARLSHSRDELNAAIAHGRGLPLSRLDQAQVQHFLSVYAGEQPADKACEAVFRATEGNPLFLNEVTKLLGNRRAWEKIAEAGVAIPGTIRHALRRRLDTLSAAAHDALQVASVLGRDFSGTMLSALWERSMADTAVALNEALEAAVILETAPSEYRFGHVLQREVLHQAITDARRTELHLKATELLRQRRPDALVWSEIANHYLEAGAAGREGAVSACVRAAEAAKAQLAFSDARLWYARALTALGQDPTADLRRRGTLLLSLADAELHSGAIDTGKRTCQRAAELARTLGDAVLFGRAALTYGSVLVFAAVDPDLVRLLREALAQLNEGEFSLRAVLTARLAAALQPSSNPEEPIAMAREALAMARRGDNPKVWLETARYAVSAMMDLAKPSERLSLNREYIQRARELGQNLEVLRGQMRAVFDYFELGDTANAELAIEAVELTAQDLGHPFYAWRVHCFHAMAAIFQGRFAKAQDHMTKARELGRRAKDPNWVCADVMQRFVLYRMQGRYKELLDLRTELPGAFRDMEHGDLLTRLYGCEALHLAGRSGQAVGLIQLQDIRRVISSGDASMLAPVIWLFDYISDPGLKTQVHEKLTGRESVFASGGMSLMLWDEPIALLIARSARQTGRYQEAIAQFERAIELAEQTGSPPYAAWSRVELAETLLDRDEGVDTTRVQKLLNQAEQTAQELTMPGLSTRVEQARARTTAASAAAEPVVPEPAAKPFQLRLARDGELWTLSYSDRQIRLRDSKGMQWLSQLLEHPGHELHVLSLVTPQQQQPLGDAGELLDAQAVAAYRSRAADLEQQLAEAEAFNDVGRREKAAAELEFLQRELSRAVGLGGRERRAGAAAERARVNVQRRLRDAIKRIQSQDAELGRYLERAITTGLYCSYRP